MANIVRAIDTPSGPLLVTVQRVADRYTTRALTADDLRQAARALFREAALMSQAQARRLETDAATVGRTDGGVDENGV